MDENLLQDPKSAPDTTVQVNDPDFLVNNEQLCRNLQEQVALFSSEVAALAAAANLILKTVVTFEFITKS